MQQKLLQQKLLQQKLLQHKLLQQKLVQQKLLQQRNNLAQNVSSKFSTESAQELTNPSPITTNLSMSYFLVLPGSESTITEITEYIHFSLL